MAASFVTVNDEKMEVTRAVSRKSWKDMKEIVISMVNSVSGWAEAGIELRRSLDC
jgi:hypothetical protein